MVIKIKVNQQNKAKSMQVTSEKKEKKTRRKMPVFNCECGAKILIVPDLLAMKKATRNHIIEHAKVTGEQLTEKNLTEAIIEAMSKTSCQ